VQTAGLSLFRSADAPPLLAKVVHRKTLLGSKDIGARMAAA
jgi:hypothetical protein